VKNIVAVASGKGGVGKSTVAANLALAWARQGARVGILDADIYGPSQPIMLGLTGQRPTSPDQKTIIPLSRMAWSRCRSVFSSIPSSPWCGAGPWSTQALSDLLGNTAWGELDYLVIDMPPGTGDIQLTLAQRVPVAGAIIVTTPQDIALADARKGLKMFEKVNVPVLGVVENMSVHVCSQCGHVEHLFGSGGGARMAAKYGVELLGELPLDSRVARKRTAECPPSWPHRILRMPHRTSSWRGVPAAALARRLEGSARACSPRSLLKKAEDSRDELSSRTTGFAAWRRKTR
jgi:ATP-binding protein involved in chromosome partitioning